MAETNRSKLKYLSVFKIHILNKKRIKKKVNAFEPVPFGADRQQQFYLYQLP